MVAVTAMEPAVMRVSWAALEPGVPTRASTLALSSPSTTETPIPTPAATDTPSVLICTAGVRLALMVRASDNEIRAPSPIHACTSWDRVTRATLALPPAIPAATATTSSATRSILVAETFSEPTLWFSPTLVYSPTQALVAPLISTVPTDTPAATRPMAPPAALSE